MSEHTKALRHQNKKWLHEESIDLYNRVWGCPIGHCA